MVVTETWERFTATGAVADYLKYRQEINSQKEKEEFEVHDRRTCNKRK